MLTLSFWATVYDKNKGLHDFLPYLSSEHTHSTTISSEYFNGAKSTEENIFVWMKKKEEKNCGKTNKWNTIQKRQNEINARWGHVYKMLFCILNRQMCFEEKCFKAWISNIFKGIHVNIWTHLKSVVENLFPVFACSILQQRNDLRKTTKTTTTSRKLEVLDFNGALNFSFALISVSLFGYWKVENQRCWRVTQIHTHYR